MNLSKSLVGVIGLPLAITLATSGCATKKYAREQAGAVQQTLDQRVNEVEKKTGAEIASLGEKTQKDLSRVEERAMTADSKAAEAARAAQQADAKAGQADQVARTAQQLAQDNQTKLGELGQTIEKASKYQMVETGDVLFGFNKTNLTPEAKAALDQLVQKMSSINRPVVEVEGFTDKTGPSDYNLALSRRRADVVVRYLVSHNIPLRSIHMIGLGEEQPSMGTTQPTAADGQQSSAPRTAADSREMRKQARRVVIRIYAPETSLSASNMDTPQAPGMSPPPQPAQTQPPASPATGSERR
jgi:outer membrane protein OmpA-like peptidoglycan-associated protein